MSKSKADMAYWFRYGASCYMPWVFQKPDIGDHRYVAHLHFEIWLRKLAASKWGWKTAEDREKVERYYAHPTNFINSYRPR